MLVKLCTCTLLSQFTLFLLVIIPSHTSSPRNLRPVGSVDAKSVLASLLAPELYHLLVPRLVDVEEEIWYRVIRSHSCVVGQNIVTLENIDTGQSL